MNVINSVFPFKYGNEHAGSQFTFKYKRALLPAILLILLVSEHTRDIAITTLSDAFWAVSVYVAFTLAIYHYLSLLIKKESKVVRLYHDSRYYQSFFSALLGALPGCGGAIIVTTQFVSGRVGFGSLVAVLTSTMGDVAFLLLASKPSVGFSLVLMGVIVGTLSGWVVNFIHKDSFMRPKKAIKENKFEEPTINSNVEKLAINLQGNFWKILIFPAIIISTLGSFQVDINQLFALPDLTMEWLGTIFIVICMLLWSFTKDINDYEAVVGEDKKHTASHPLQKVAQDTNFVTAWVVATFLVFELTLAFADINLAQVFSGWGVWMPLMGAMVGLLPGCGPQILVASLYLSGAVPMSAQLSNAISNDGDALFPAIALAPKATFFATFYSTVPALIVGYGYFWLFE
ncbi:putative manganese transporter [Psychromonas sp. KJ10-10]|uniref:putative manganese transporter n=1 Tax=Psychromonas sp. KJ10-10 TaxID=3391823 RepID=UPI0039B409B1